jgi:MFS family permease
MGAAGEPAAAVPRRPEEAPVKRSPHLATTGAIYVYFAVYGSAVIAISQSSAHLQQQWGATEGQVLQAIAGVGVGKVVGPLFAGFVSDRFGRRPAVVTGLVLVGVFLGALLVSPTWQAGFALAVLFGLANAIGDTGSYPTLMEAFPARSGTANVLAKAAIAVGQLALPLAVTATAGAGLAWGTPFVVLLVVVGGLVAVQLRARFPDHRGPAREDVAAATTADPDALDAPDPRRPRAGVDGAALVAYAFCATAMFWLAQSTLPQIGVHLGGMSADGGRTLVAAYSAGSVVGVLATAALVARAVRGVTVLAVYPVLAALAYAGLLVAPGAVAFGACAFGIGVFAAGGLFQLTVAVLAGLFPRRKGVVTSMVGLASGLAAFVLPFVSGLVVGDGSSGASSYRLVVGLGIGVAAAAAVLGQVVRRRHGVLRPVAQPAAGSLTRAPRTANAATAAETSEPSSRYVATGHQASCAQASSAVATNGVNPPATADATW